ncbi:unnamed protein product [Durusdinium trenchii]|uniref:Meiosis-specific nuclear structural protein 1 n=1 Tax=Durusdinium trenchii TaxID=1381693 RepID=A0ABP0S5Q0_9DINO
MRLKEQAAGPGTHEAKRLGVRELRVELEAKESQNQELMAIAEHVRAQEDARKHAEEKLKMAQQAAQADAAEKDRRYAELFHMVCQVDREVAARRTAEQRLEVTSASARQAVAKATEEALRSEAKANEAEERAQVAEPSSLHRQHRHA